MYQIDKVEFGKIPESEFRLASLGIEEPAQPGQRSGHFWLLIVGGLAAIGLGILFIVFARRHHADE